MKLWATLLRLVAVVLAVAAALNVAWRLLAPTLLPLSLVAAVVVVVCVVWQRR